MLDYENASANDSYPSPTPPGHPYQKWLRIGVIIVIYVVSLVGNTSVCMWMWRNKQFRARRMNRFILHLTCADMLVTWFTMLSQIVFESIGTVWLLDEASCRIFKMLQNFSIVSSTYVVTSIAIDRAFAIARPLSRPPSVNRFLIVAWLCSLIPSIPSLFLFHRRQEGVNTYFCSSIFHDILSKAIYRQVYMLFIWLCVFFIPLLIILVSYILIVWTIWKKAHDDAKAAGANHVETVGNHVTRRPITTGPVCNSSLPKAKMKTLKMTIVIVLTFIVCNLPYYTQEMILAFGDPSILDMTFVAISGIISASNSAANPYIFLLFSSRNKFVSSAINQFCLSCIHSKPSKSSYSPRSQHRHGNSEDNSNQYTITMYTNRETMKQSSGSKHSNECNF
ncbi:PREDICTED: arg8-vasotocin receptor-like [Priapulus caudatus]|uniref:Arg8-vasotocin receptor-like n=1 Tax=Priapulus caudatus TaxID=37621 RepID=A0ABM1EFC4_PRICU|nr:PREDICTED: arg8-vasotocin receptor-like [Priapulus caudatus]